MVAERVLVELVVWDQEEIEEISEVQLLEYHFLRSDFGREG